MYVLQNKSRNDKVVVAAHHTNHCEDTEKNSVYIENGQVKMNLVTDTMSIEEAKELTLKAIDLEYSLP